PQHLKLRRLDRIVVGVLNLFQQFAIVAKEAGASSGGNEFLKKTHCEVGLAGPDSADQEQPSPVSRIKLLHEARGTDVGKRNRGIGSREVRRKVRQLTMLISLRNPRRRDQGAAARPQLAIAARHTALGRSRSRLPS